MTKIHRSALIRFPAHWMFDLVNDIESYPEFLPWCESSKVLVRRDGLVEARLDLAGSGVRKSFTTRNTFKDKASLRMSLIEGPFSRLEGIWTFQSLREDASKISLDLDFEIAGGLVNIALGAVFSQICNTLVGAFSQRAKDLYRS
ncbi:MAG: type II toxin-antitoxin system RatA family toxin [Methylococcaceae bacterium]|nr:type II toxin-antitoxin system RatA family toxin [Methylococcaceae bacterium]MCI0667090.1 type II toxin-antitoxin system RatA family toxin [Methylococcaceae bacterium]MCI0733855.1 type II toxin-antitoxin system RatA family toxin [Methylococcaceae bacterium]